MDEGISQGGIRRVAGMIGFPVIDLHNGSIRKAASATLVVGGVNRRECLFSNTV
jgi:hypothetical protein